MEKNGSLNNRIKRGIISLSIVHYTGAKVYIIVNNINTILVFPNSNNVIYKIYLTLNFHAFYRQKYAGDNFVRFSGDAHQFASKQGN